MPEIPLRNREKILIDTDIGDDIDDLLALAFAVNSPEIELIGVTTVFRNTLLKARIARKLLRLAGKAEIAVVPGAAKPLQNRSFEPFFTECDFDAAPSQYAADMENEPGALAERSEAVDFILQKTLATDGDMTLVAIGPLTNIARVITRNAAAARKIKRVVLMGGAYFSNAVEYNIRCDPEAAAIVFESGIAITGIGLDVTLQCRLAETDLQRIRQHGSMLSDFLYRMITIWRGNTRNLPYLHDPLAIGSVLNQGFVHLTPKAIAVETQGAYTRGMTFNITDSNWWNPDPLPANAQVGRSVDQARFVPFFMERILAS